jgi:hypothetical protein
MTSALAALANATAVFTLPTVGTITDPTTGNVVPATETVTVNLYLRSFGFLERVREFPGVETKDDTYEGYAVSPQALDARIKPGVVGTVAIGDEDPQPCEVLVARHPYGSTGLLGNTLQQVLGDKIRLAKYSQQ